MYVCVHDSRIVWVTNNNRQKMTEILLEIQSDKLNASTQDAGEFLGYLRRRGSTATGSRRASMTSGESQEEQEQAPDTTQKGRSKTDREASTSASKRNEDKKSKEQTKGVFSLRRSFLGRTNSKDMGEARKRMARVNSLNVLNSIGFLMRNAGASLYKMNDELGRELLDDTGADTLRLAAFEHIKVLPSGIVSS